MPPSRRRPNLLPLWSNLLHRRRCNFWKARSKRRWSATQSILLELDADRLLHNTRKYAGLEPKAPLYGGWEARGIAGHTLGHYLTALSQQYAATGDARFKERLDYIVEEMAEAQKAYGDGYVGALPPLELKTMRDFKKGIVEPSSGFNLQRRRVGAVVYAAQSTGGS